jgi:hypothetical protein
VAVSFRLTETPDETYIDIHQGNDGEQDAVAGQFLARHGFTQVLDRIAVVVQRAFIRSSTIPVFDGEIGTRQRDQALEHERILDCVLEMAMDNLGSFLWRVEIRSENIDWRVEVEVYRLSGRSTRRLSGHLQ